MSTEDKIKQIDDFMMMLDKILDSAFKARDLAETALQDGADARQRLRAYQRELLLKGKG